MGCEVHEVLIAAMAHAISAMALHEPRTPSGSIGADSEHRWPARGMTETLGAGGDKMYWYQYGKATLSVFQRRCSVFYSGFRPAETRKRPRKALLCSAVPPFSRIGKKNSD